MASCKPSDPLPKRSRKDGRVPPATAVISGKRIVQDEERFIVGSALLWFLHLRLSNCDSTVAIAETRAFVGNVWCTPFHQTLSLHARDLAAPIAHAIRRR